MGLAASERQQLVDLAEQVGPDAPTLCAGWDTEALVDHLLIRERRPDAAAGMSLAFLRGHADKVTARLESTPWQARLDTLRSGPPAWNPMGWGKLEELTNGAEFLVHHEDVRRGAPGWEPRELDPDTAAAVLALVRGRFAKLMARKLAAGAVAVLPDGERIALRAAAEEVEIHGEPLEILLWLFGRSAVRVDFVGDPDAVASLNGSSRGF